MSMMNENTVPETAAAENTSPENEDILTNEEPEEQVIENRVPGRRQNDCITWDLDESGTLTLSGHGGVADFYSGDLEAAPWDEVKGEIRSLVVEEGITDLGIRAFENCTALEEVVLPRTMRRIHYAAFNGCTSLIDIEIILRGRMQHLTESLSNDDYGFEEADHRQTIVFGMHAFTGTPWAQEAFGDFYEEDGVIYDYFGTADTVVIPEGTKEIARFAFADCGLKSVTIPQTVMTIGICAFENNDLSELTLPGDPKNPRLRYIRQLAFHNNPNLKKVIIPDVESTIIRDKAFLGTQFRPPIREADKPETLYKIGLSRVKGAAGCSRLEIKESDSGVPAEMLDIRSSVLKRVKQGAVIAHVQTDEIRRTVTQVICYGFDKDQQAVFKETWKITGHDVSPSMLSEYQIMADSTEKIVAYTDLNSFANEEFWNDLWKPAGLIFQITGKSYDSDILRKLVCEWILEHDGYRAAAE